MNIFPAIDLLNGQSVRLYQGDYQQVSTVNPDPVAQAKAVAAAGLRRLHVVDLDGAKAGKPQNKAVVAKLRQSTDLFLEIGGGIRTLTEIEAYLELGVDRVILGSVALKDPQLVATAVEKFGSAKIVVGIDGQNGQVATEGWLDQSQVNMSDLMAAMLKVGVTQFIVTDIARDGTLTGPNVALLQDLQETFPAATVVASGGMHDAGDLAALQQAGLTDVIVGKALQKGTLTLAELAAVDEPLKGGH
ncbi:1-(5-phosphoribosyl)-5-[(5-phosphoribosylamino)methylideneamino]imidazole-4-carboxamide isomerase [Loigolactobacillus bifermentans]|uniref:1-(5-phosphoribosyl)-5-[(5-phosphoribosylamino)methylideneamino] imidazole-4-carboxamide isomerase n=1 Tax=Loigolactobacillus bifermentans DSM 20003 TaxID=1423726 RepID=A0A0R1HAC6_9LACO|nr:1-(5-phosphoribosyl)-5-[(5-phosphoribosylamino)methylideneamino]imidazole-4-carboxamide isomerase [Loigolactobacillus bifermentans]KRK40642.1 1-(5-phosphoribosyl)-5-[(5-phosphoribosylamino)methylideneamino] imidazole-4-carboxamide isomerase [Loigolactobacillus bifermentans DSM 20003]QGG60684.1 1-(5-phosphoribosyl)-5-[(5-phosphoribosylamino)methylideneamino]imidazole-4-carboxamide isomerase [Loigolactobacillus bifermentans]